MGAANRTQVLCQTLISTEPSVQPQIPGVFQLEEIGCARKNWDKD